MVEAEVTHTERDGETRREGPIALSACFATTCGLGFGD